MTGRDPGWAGIGLIFMLSLVWGFNWPSIRVAVGEFSPWTFRAVCLLVGTIALFSIALIRKTPMRITRRDALPLVAVGILNVGAYHLLPAFGLTMIEAGRGAILAFTFPLWSVVLGAIILKERITPGRFAALILGLGAMALLMGPELTDVGGTPVGGLLLIASAVSWSIATVIVKSRHWDMVPFALATWQVLIGGIPIIAGAIWLGNFPNPESISASAWIGLFYSSVVAVAAGQYLWFRILPVMPAAVASISTLATPVVGVWSASIFLGEPISWREIAALVLVTAALSMVLIGGEGWKTIRRTLGLA